MLFRSAPCTAPTSPPRWTRCSSRSRSISWPCCAWRRSTSKNLGGTHFCAQSRDRNSFPLILLRLAGFRGAQALAKIGALRQRRLAASSTGRASPPLPWGQNLAPNRALGLAASHTPGAKFPCMCPARMHMSSGRDFLTACNSVFTRVRRFFALKRGIL